VLPFEFKGSSRHDAIPADFLNLKGGDPTDAINLFADAYPAAYQTLYEAKPITFSVTASGRKFECTVILLDVVSLRYRCIQVMVDSSTNTNTTADHFFLVFVSSCKLTNCNFSFLGSLPYQ